MSLPACGTARLQPDGSVVVDAPAKVNLYLHVVGRRDDGYHLLDSLMVFAGVRDTLTLRPSDRLSLRLDGPTAAGLAAEDDNIVLRAARVLAGACGVAPAAEIALTKRLPVAAGIGGGSADAAAALRGLCLLWDVALPERELMRLALGLGADVPVCLRGRPTAVTGVGEGLADAPALPPAWLALVNPGVGVSTPAVFKARDEGFSEPLPLECAPADAAELAAMLARRRNELMTPALRLAPVIGDVLGAIARCEGVLLSRMSGSGATCFGLFAEEKAAQAAAATIADAHPDWWTAAAPLVSR